MVKEEKVSAEQAVRDIRRQTRRTYNTEEKIRIVVEGLRGEAMTRNVLFAPGDGINSATIPLARRLLSSRQYISVQ